MENFNGFLKESLGQFFGSIWDFIVGVWSQIKGLVTRIFNLKEYVNIFDSYKEGFNTVGYILAYLIFVLLIGIVVGLVVLIVLLIKHRIRVKRARENSKELVSEIQSLNNQVLRLTKEKDRILAIKSGAPVGSYSASSYEEDENGESTSQLKEGESRFYKLSQVDDEMRNYDAINEGFDNDISLNEICERFRNFACGRMGLYYDIRIIRLFVAAMSSTRLIILQGISGTGKTSLPYAWGKFLENDSQIASVQPSWRDRSELFGYFNEFTKRFSETEVLKKMYEASYTDRVYFTILDEMNIARVEYYFAEMLSILEMPSRDEWIVDLVPSGWASDPKHIKEGRFKLPENMWYIGTANNDDSTFAISDKVYDRAIPINIDSKGVKFDPLPSEPLHLNYKYLEGMFNVAKEEHKVSDEALAKIEQLDDYVIEHFRLAFGNRIVKQLRDFVPAYVACGGTEIDGLDYVLTNKIFRKFEGLNLAFIRDEIDGLVSFLSDLFGKDNMQEAKTYLKRLKKLV